MSSANRRKELREQYDRMPAQAGVYRIVNTANNRALLGSTTNLANIRNKLAFAQSTNTGGVLDLKLRNDVADYGIDAFSLEILEVLEPGPEQTVEEIRNDLEALEALWREQQNPADLY